MDIYVWRKDLRHGTKIYVCHQSKSYKLLIPLKIGYNNQHWKDCHRTNPNHPNGHSSTKINEYDYHYSWQLETKCNGDSCDVWAQSLEETINEKNFASLHIDSLNLTRWGNILQL